MVLSKRSGAAGSRFRKPSAPCTPRAISATLSTSRLGREVSVKHGLVDARERPEVANRALLVDLVHGFADQAELQHRAVAADSPETSAESATLPLPLNAAMARSSLCSR